MVNTYGCPQKRLDIVTAAELGARRPSVAAYVLGCFSVCLLS